MIRGARRHLCRKTTHLTPLSREPRVLLKTGNSQTPPGNPSLRPTEVALGSRLFFFCFCFHPKGVPVSIAMIAGFLFFFILGFAVGEMDDE